MNMPSINLQWCYCPPLSRKRGDIKSHSSVRPSVPLSVCLSVTKTLTLAITFALLQIEPWYLACVFLWQDFSDGTMSWPWRWPLTYFKVKFVAERGTTILWICLFTFTFMSKFARMAILRYFESGIQLLACCIIIVLGIISLIKDFFNCLIQNSLLIWKCTIYH